MRKFLLLFSLLLSSLSGNASDIEIDGIYYGLNMLRNTATVTYRGENPDSFEGEYSGNVVIPETVIYDGRTFEVEWIGYNAFEGCTGLTSVSIPNSIKEIGWMAFSGCSSLTSISIPSSVEMISWYAFQDCGGLTSVTIPESVIQIGISVFSGCSALESIVVESGNPIYDSRAGCNAIIETASNTLISGCKNTIIPSSVTSIDNGAFAALTGLTSISIPNSVTEIGQGAFFSCSGLTSITISNSVTKIGGYAFRDCSGLTSITIPNSVTEIGYEAFSGCSGLTSVIIGNSVTTIGPEAFLGCSGLTSVTIPNSVTSIGGYAFRDCGSLTSVIIGNSVIWIGEYAFSDCSGLTSITIPESVTSIGTWAFAGCDLESIVVESGNTKYDSRGGCNALIETASNKLIVGCKNTIIPSSVTAIEETAFAGCSGLTSITIPRSVTTIAVGAFYVCSGLESIVVESGNPNYDSREGCNAIIETASNTLIAGCKNTRIPSGVTAISHAAFSGCSGLTSINIPSSVTEIGNWAFYDCTSLTSITIPSNVTEIGLLAFFSCSGLTDVYCFAEEIPSTGKDAFNDVNLAAATLHVPAASLEKYEEAEPWNEFGKIVALTEEELTGIEDLNDNSTCSSQVNGKVVYELSGKRISDSSALRKGFFIINGRKVLVK